MGITKRGPARDQGQRGVWRLFKITGIGQALRQGGARFGRQVNFRHAIDQLPAAAGVKCNVAAGSQARGGSVYIQADRFEDFALNVVVPRNDHVADRARRGAVDVMPGRIVGNLPFGGALTIGRGDKMPAHLDNWHIQRQGRNDQPRGLR